jgi:hypothetical protein
VVQARDYGINDSPFSNPVAVTIEASDRADTTPPTMPANLTDNGMAFPDGETWLFRDPSTDDLTPQSLIRHNVYLNGGLNHSVVGRGTTILYGTVGVLNTFQGIAVDSAGNQSSAATWTVDLL